VLPALLSFPIKGLRASKGDLSLSAPPPVSDEAALQPWCSWRELMSSLLNFLPSLNQTHAGHKEGMMR